MSSAYPMIWAMKHAPTADIYEQMILILMADSADEDGCNAYRSKRRIAELANGVDERTVVRKWRSLEARGLIRRDTTPPPTRYLRIPKNRRPVRWEVCIPYSWWSAAQIEDVQRGREDRGLEPLTAESRPDITAAPPPKTPRSDKGRPNPKRSRKKSPASADESSHSQAEQTELAWGVSETPQESDAWGVSQSPPGVSLSHPQGCLSDTQPSPSTAPGVPSSPPAPPVTKDGASVPTENPLGREDEPSTENVMERAQGLVDSAVLRWPSRFKAPGARDRLRLAQRVATELDTGGDESVILNELTRDLSDVGDVLRVMFSARTSVAGWGRSVDPRPDHSRYEVSGPKPPWCGRCDERTRHVVGQAADGSERSWRCSRCHPQTDDHAQTADTAGTGCPAHPGALQTAAGCYACRTGAAPTVPEQSNTEVEDLPDPDPALTAEILQEWQQMNDTPQR